MLNTSIYVTIILSPLINFDQCSVSFQPHQKQSTSIDMEKTQLFTYTLTLCTVLSLAVLAFVFCILAEFKKSKVDDEIHNKSSKFPLLLDFQMKLIVLFVWWTGRGCESRWEIVWIARKWSVLARNCSFDMFYYCSNHRKLHFFCRILVRFKGKKIMLSI